jgi:hypothetical protein
MKETETVKTNMSRSAQTNLETMPLAFPSLYKGAIVSSERNSPLNRKRTLSRIYLKGAIDCTKHNSSAAPHAKQVINFNPITLSVHPSDKQDLNWQQLH